MSYKLLEAYRRDPVLMVHQEFGVEPDHHQVDFMRAFAGDRWRRIAAKACKGPGKTAELAWCIWNFLLCYGDKDNHPKGAATSITGDNLDDNLWPELAKWQSRSELLTKQFEWTKTRLSHREFGKDWFFSARTWPKQADATRQADTLSGLHADYLLFVLDEVGGIPKAVTVTADAGLATGKWAKVLMAGNPTHTDGPLYDACTSESHLWYVVEITGDPDDPERCERISIQWAQEQIDLYGRDNPWVMVNVLGKFPPSSINTLLGPDEVRASMKRKIREFDYSFAQKRIGIDPARFGDDRTVMFPRQGKVAFRPIIMRNARTNEIATKYISAKQKWGSEADFIDDTGGFGAGVIDFALLAGHNIMPVMFSGKADDPRYFNKRAEMWFLMAEWIKAGGAMPYIPEMVRELVAPTYTYHGNKFQLEEKKQIKERIGVSPDLADGLALTFAMVDMPSAEYRGPGSVFHDVGHMKFEWMNEMEDVDVAGGARQGGGGLVSDYDVLGD